MPREERPARVFLGRRRAKNARSVKIRRRSRKLLLVKRKLLKARFTHLDDERASSDEATWGGYERAGAKSTRGFWAAKAQKSVNDRFYVPTVGFPPFCNPAPTKHLRRRSNRRFAEHENQRRPSLSFACHSRAFASASLIVSRNFISRARVQLTDVCGISK
jgi:hypothetical protein